MRWAHAWAEGGWEGAWRLSGSEKTNRQWDQHSCMAPLTSQWGGALMRSWGTPWAYNSSFCPAGYQLDFIPLSLSAGVWWWWGWQSAGAALQIDGPYLFLYSESSWQFSVLLYCVYFVFYCILNILLYSGVQNCVWTCNSKDVLILYCNANILFVFLLDANYILIVLCLYSQCMMTIICII